MVTVVFLGKLADLAGAPSMQIAAPLDWDGLKTALPQALANALDDPRNRVAVNGALIADKSGMRADAGDEIALLPPVSGG